MPLREAEEYGFGIAMKDGKVIGYYTNGQSARPFMYPALKNNVEKVIRMPKWLLERKSPYENVKSQYAALQKVSENASDVLSGVDAAVLPAIQFTEEENKVYERTGK